REFLHSVRKVRCFIDRSSEKYDAADLVFRYVAFQRKKLRALLIKKTRVDADVYKLADLFFVGHFLESFISPFPRVFRWFEAVFCGNLRRCEHRNSAQEKCVNYDKCENISGHFESSFVLNINVAANDASSVVTLPIIAYHVHAMFVPRRT